MRNGDTQKKRRKRREGETHKLRKEGRGDKLRKEGRGDTNEGRKEEKERRLGNGAVSKGWKKVRKRMKKKTKKERKEGKRKDD